MRDVSQLYALPPDVSEAIEPRVTGITCPECSGVLGVVREGRGTLRFICRVGHAVSVDELLAGKEDKIETDMWASVRALEELIALLRDLEAYARRHGRGQTAGPHHDRIAQARDHAQRLRGILEEKRPVDLASSGDAGTAVDRAPRVPKGG